MAVRIATLPGAPLALADLTPGLASPPEELTALRDAATAVAAGLGTTKSLVVCPSESPSVWLAGDLGLGGFGTGDPPRPWTSGPAGTRLAPRLGLESRSDDIPTEGRVVARLLDATFVVAIVGLARQSTDLATAIVAAARDEDLAIVAAGDLSAGVGPDSPRPGNTPNLEGLVGDGAVNRTVLGRILEHPDASIAAALQVLLLPELPALFGDVHVVRGVATLVADGR